MNTLLFKSQLIHFGLSLLLTAPISVQKSEITLINKNNSCNKIHFSLYNSQSNMPITSREMFASGQMDASCYINKIAVDKPVLLSFSWDWKNQLVYLSPIDTLGFRLTDSKHLPYQFTGNRNVEELVFFSSLETSKLGSYKYRARFDN